MARAQGAALHRSLRHCWRPARCLVGTWRSAVWPSRSRAGPEAGRAPVGQRRCVVVGAVGMVGSTGLRETVTIASTAGVRLIVGCQITR